ncbi:glycosyltransferase [Aliarcobacter cryaerophilus]|uniref:glycosyltransferase n=1 Tax=Aliarcobacter cryaerophilus TaxID=28198 RepID=UPI0021B53CE6|nr:glycosyltransferase [Aliarcobacter cryaerophilus]MCT7487111.1 glycosyltransferase [Aliarcobacter cryaerophilus]MCT7491575.1 glycosyltransferase [Aliarcobacter cryaerophilus]
MKGLFITHDISIYGASRSLQGVLKNIDIEYDLIIPKKLRSKNNIGEVKDFFGGKAKNIYEFYLPFEQCFVGKDENLSIKSKLNVLMKRFLFQITKQRLYSLIKNQNYDFVHLNSLVLYPVIKKDLPFFMHVRELFDGTNSVDVFNKLQLAKGVIFIDNEVKKPFKSINFRRHNVLNNPVDMTKVSDYKIQKNNTTDIVFAIIGAISEEKGIDFLIQAFNLIDDDKFKLYIVGNGKQKYVEYCKKMITNKNIIFYGEEKEIEKIYALSDVVIRAEHIPRVGRTIYEALYSGNQILLPFNEELFKMEDFELFKDVIYFYETRNINSIIKSIQTSKQKTLDYAYKSNIKEYIKSFKNFME